MMQPYTLIPSVDEAVTPISEPLHTTLYDLIEAMHESVESPDDTAAITAAVLHVLNTCRVTCRGKFKDYRLTGESDPRRGLPSASPSQGEKAVVSF
jgi:hypothetical protein